MASENRVRTNLCLTTPPPIIYTHTHSNLTVFLSIPDCYQSIRIKKDVENASKLVEVKASIQKSTEIYFKGEEIAQIKDESFGQGSQERTTKSQGIF